MRSINRLLSTGFVCMGLLATMPITHAQQSKYSSLEFTRWDSAKQANTIEAYTLFLDLHPSGPYSDLARSNIKELEKTAADREEENRWNAAVASNTIEDYQSFIQAYRNSAYVNFARERIANISNVQNRINKLAIEPNVNLTAPKELDALQRPNENNIMSILYARYPNDPSSNAEQLSMARKYSEGTEIEKDVAHAYLLYLASSTQGNLEAMMELAKLSALEDHPIIDKTVSKYWAEKAISKDGRKTSLMLAGLYRDGIVFDRNEVESTLIYKNAADKGDLKAYVPYGVALRDGLGIVKNEVEAAWLLATATNLNIPDADIELAKVSEDAMVAARNKYKDLIIKDQNSTKTAMLVNPNISPYGTSSANSTKKEQATTVRNAEPIKNMSQSEVIFANRKALVIGNDSYKSVSKLLTAGEDARAMAEGLKRVGYQVTLKTDLDRQGMNAAIRTFKSQIEGGDEVAIFYAGHGVQLSNTNFLLPVDISGESEEQIKDDAIPLQRLLDDISDKHAKFTLAMIDACRDNPFKAATGRSIGGMRGLSPTSAATGQMIVFSAGTGQQALDRLGPNDRDKNGVFTRIFLKQLDTQGVSIDRIVRNVRAEVVGLAKSVGHDQVPAIYDQVVGDFFFRK